MNYLFIILYISLILYFIKLINKQEVLYYNLELFKNKNSCNKPFEATCDKNKIYNRLLYIEQNLDKLDYLIYLQNKKFSKYDRMFGEYNDNQQQMKKTASQAIEEAKIEMQKAMADKQREITEQATKSRSTDVSKMKEESERADRESAANRKAAVKNLGSTKVPVKKCKLISWPSSCPSGYRKSGTMNKKTRCCPVGFKIKLSGKGPEVNIMSKMLNKSSAQGSPNDAKEWNKSKSKADMPFGFVL
jgi:hypothetical protein